MILSGYPSRILGVLLFAMLLNQSPAPAQTHSAPARARPVPAAVQDEIDRLRATADPARRATAAEALGAMGATAMPAVPWLVAAVNDQSKVLSLKHGEIRVGAIVANALSQIGDNARSYVQNLLSDPVSTPIQRGNAACALVRMQTPGALDMLLATLPLAYTGSDRDGHFGWELSVALDCFTPDVKVAEAYLRLHAAATAAGSNNARQIDHRFFCSVGHCELSALNRSVTDGPSRVKELEDWWAQNKATVALKAQDCIYR